MDKNGIAIHPIYLALTRESLIYGVTSDYFGVNLSVSMIAFILSPIWGLLFIPIHLIGVAICRVDVNIFNMFFKYPYLPHLKNKNIWGVRTYEPW